jgi:hypothetical protein
MKAIILALLFSAGCAFSFEKPPAATPPAASTPTPEITPPEETTPGADLPAEMVIDFWKSVVMEKDAKNCSHDSDARFQRCRWK